MLIYTNMMHFISYEDSQGGGAAQKSGSLKLKYIWPHCHRCNLHFCGDWYCLQRRGFSPGAFHSLLIMDGTMKGTWARLCQLHRAAVTQLNLHWQEAGAVVKKTAGRARSRGFDSCRSERVHQKSPNKSPMERLPALLLRASLDKSVDSVPENANVRGIWLWHACGELHILCSSSRSCMKPLSLFPLSLHVWTCPAVFHFHSQSHSFPAV